MTLNDSSSKSSGRSGAGELEKSGNAEENIFISSNIENLNFPHVAVPRHVDRLIQYV